MNFLSRPRSPGELYALLALQVDAYHKHRHISSTSIPTETARELLASLSYTLTKGQTLPQGQEALRQQFSRCLQLLSLVRATAPVQASDPWHDTVFSLGRFLDAYDLQFFAHRTPLFLDYPLLHDPGNLPGLDYVETYLRGLWQENQILSCFDSQLLERLCFCVDPDFHSIPLNLCEQPLYNALGRAMLQLPPLDLTLTGGDILALGHRLRPLSDQALAGMVAAAMTAVLSAMALPDPGAAHYASSVTTVLLPRLRTALDTDAVIHVFLPIQ